MTKIVKRFAFEAAHQLPNHDGACKRLHGHSYIVEVQVEGTLDQTSGSPTEGMVIDFGHVSKVFKERVFAVCDHQYLNDVLPVPVTTAEHIAWWILGEMTLGLEEQPRDVLVSAVRVWETATGYAEVSP